MPCTYLLAASHPPVNEGDTVINATYEDGIVTRETAEGILERVVAGMCSMI